MSLYLNMPSVLQRAIKLLSNRDYSPHALRNKLQEKAYSKEEIDDAIHQLKKKKILQPELYTEIKVRTLIQRGLSPELIQLKVSEEKLSAPLELIYEIMIDINITAEEQVKQLLTKRSRKPGEVMNKYFAKLQRYLYSKGHYGPDVDQIIQKFCHHSNT